MKYIYLSILPILFISCFQEKDCPAGGLNLALVGFNQNGNDTITIQSFKKNTNFITQLKSYDIILSNAIEQRHYLNITNDTVYIVEYADNYDEDNGLLTFEYDWKILTPTETYQISLINFNLETQKIGLVPMDTKACFSPIIKYTINGQNMQTVNKINTLFLNN